VVGRYTSSMERLMLLDGFGLVYRGYYALPPLTTSKGDLVNGVQSQLRALGSQLDVGRATSGIRYRVLRDDATAGKKVLGERQPKVVLILGAEAEASE